MKKVILFSIVIVSLANTLFGQEKEITADERRQAFRPAYDKLFETSYREITEEETYEGGKLKEKRKTVGEFIPPDKYHFITVELVGEKSRKSETFIIDRIYYCRKDDGEWTKSEKGCGGSGGGREGGPDSLVNVKFTSEETKLNTERAILYQEYMTYIFPEEKLSYSLDKFWINEEGFMLRREKEYGSVEPKFVRSKKTEVYEYNPKDLKIEAPIK